MFVAQILLNSLVIGTQVLLLALALYLVFSVSKVYHLALGGVGTLVAYTVYWGVTKDASITMLVILGIAAALILGVVCYFLLEPFIRKQEDMLAVLVTFALLVIFESGAAIVFGSDGKSLVEGILPTISIGSAYITTPGAITIVFGIVVAILSALVVTKTAWGRLLRGIAENKNLVTSLQVNASKIRFLVFLVASMMAGTIVVLSSLNTALTPRGSFDLLVMAFVALLIGGIKDIRGTIIASYLVSLIPELIIGLSGTELQLSASWKMFFVFIIAIILLIWRPEGLLTRKGRTT